ncbi:toll-like receptor 1 [Pelobates cultripes]|uniref:Toll-like receptor 1, partial n=1 Tax=Pelobates cultripes TaxID=61616 RepID=A0AAD1SEQ2_PELCU|nr:toll-like receptor 1 [Pelobates cultripes]
MAFVSFCLLAFASSFVGTWCATSPSVIANYSGQGLSTVPTNLSSLTTILDLSFNFIHALEDADFSYMSELRLLNLSHNALNELDCKVFEFNKNLEFVDLSNNSLKNISGLFPEALRHLDISFNDFKTMSVCKGLANLLQLEYLGIGAAEIERSDFEAITHLQLRYALIELQRLSGYEAGSISMLNTEHIHIILPGGTFDPYSVLIDAVRTTKSLELSNISGWQLKNESEKYMADIANNSIVTDLTLSHIKLDWFHLIKALQCIWHSSVEKLYIYDLNLFGFVTKMDFDYSNTSMKEFVVDKASTTVFLFNQEYLYRVFAEMNVENLTIISANIIFMVCPLKPSTIQNIHFEDNALPDKIFSSCNTLTQLRSLNLAQNKLEKVSKISEMTQNMPSLKHLDISTNPLHYTGEVCHWSQSIIWLNLASCDLTSLVFNCLPKSLKILILKNNDITHIPLEMTKLENLKLLNLAFNRMSDLPDCSFFTRLAVLNVQSNIISSPSRESIKSCQSVKELNVRHNPFQCDCDLKNFIDFEKMSPGKLIGWPDSYICEHPDDSRGINLKNIHIPIVYCNVYLLIAIIVLPIMFIVALLYCLCKYFDGPWYLKMLCQWTRTKHRIRRKKNGYEELQKETVFHAFVSYSEHDASWVKHTLLPNLEKNNASIRICQHERNFVAGKSIVENIINCIDKSYKSIFVLSPNFVQSEWCHYELYFAHHKLYTENTDNLILILLEPIPQYLIPSKYYKLKTLMSQRTYLEWPKETGKHGLFWANLRAAININLPDPESQSSSSVSHVSS